MKAKYEDSKIKWQFARMEEIVKYIAHKFNIETESDQLIRVTGSLLKSLRKISVRINLIGEIDHFSTQISAG